MNSTPFAIERRGRGSKGRPPKQIPKGAEEDLFAEVQRLRAENEYLKKLQALVLEDERHQRKRRAGSSGTKAKTFAGEPSLDRSVAARCLLSPFETDGYLSSSSFTLAMQSQLVELDPETGDVTKVIFTTGNQAYSLQPAGLSRRAYYVTTSGFLNTVNLNEGRQCWRSLSV